MGTRFNLLLPGIDKLEGDQIFSTCLQELNRLENMLSCFIPTSDISFLNKNAIHHPVEISNELLEIITSCLDYHKITEGLFDISLGNIIDKKPGVKIRETGVDKIILNPQNKTIQFPNQNIKLNLGGYGKGYALSKIKDLLIKLGITSAFISFGESSVYGLGKHPYGDFWPVGIQDFYQKDKSIDAIKLVDQSVSTSGNLETENHIIHPKNGKAVTERKTVTVKLTSPIDTEVLSTALMVADSDQKKRILKSFSEVEVTEVKYLDQKANIIKYKS